MGTKGSTTVLEPLWQKLPAHEAGALAGSASCALAGRYEAVRSAREFTRRTLLRWSLPQEYDNIALVVSELVTNALRHGLPGAPCASAGAGAVSGPPVRLHLMRWPARLVCAVRDPSAEPPKAVDRETGLNGLAACRTFEAFEHLEGLEGLEGPEGADTFDELVDHAAESGRGLQLVDSFSDCWGWHRLTGALPGKVVWALFRLDPV